MKRLLNKWQFGFRIYNPPEYLSKFIFRLDFYVLKVISFPNEGCVLERKHYKGFLLSKTFAIDIVITTKNVKFYKDMYINVPYKINIFKLRFL